MKAPGAAGHDHAGHDHAGSGGSLSAGEMWDQRYAATDHVWTAEPDELLVELAGPLEPGKALDLAAGEGRNACWLASRGWQVTAVDASRVAIERALARAGAQGTELTTLVADLADYEPEAGAFDLVVVSNLHLERSLHSLVLDRARVALAPGGHLFVVGHHRESAGLGGPPDPERLYTEEIVREALAGLDILRLEKIERLHEGHGSTHSVFDVLGWAVRR